MQIDDPKHGQIYRHYKHGHLYTYICTAEPSDGNSDVLDRSCVIYQSHQNGRIYMRQIQEFFEEMKDNDGSIKRRFELVS